MVVRRRCGSRGGDGLARRSAEPGVHLSETVTGEISARLIASTTGTDSDFVVKLIDVYPEDAQAPRWNAGGPAPASTRSH